MRKFFTSLFILTIALSAVLSPVGSLKVDAQLLNPIDTGGSEYYNLNDPVRDEYVTKSSGNSQGAVAGNLNTSKNPAAEQQKTAGCVAPSPWVPFFEIHLDACVANVVYLLMWVMSWILWLSGKILDMSIYYTINMAGLLKNVPVVDIGWKLFRDLSNIFFIFILLWTAISTILGLISGKTKEIIIHLVIVALLMNFSLFFTKVFIDGSNIVAIHFYNLIVAAPPSNTVGAGSQNVIGSLTPNGSFSGAFMEGLKIQSLFDTQATAGSALSEVGGQIINSFKVILIGGFGIALMMVAAYVFFVVAILFMVRLITLMMLMILSPLAFLSFILPSTEGYAEQWIEKLISQSIFAPIYLSICFVVVKSIQSPAFKSVMSVSGSQTSESVGSAAAVIFGADTGSTAGFSFIFNFILLIGLMLGSIIVAHKLEAGGVEFATETGKEAGGFIGRSIARGRYVPTIATVANMGGLGSGAIRMMGQGLQKLPERWGANGMKIGAGGIGKSLETFSKRLGTKEGRKSMEKSVDMNELNKSFIKSKFGATELGSFIREKTTGGSLFGVKAKFGGEKDVHEAYEEAEKLKNRKFALGHIDNSLFALEKLNEAKTTGDNKAIRAAESLVSGSLSKVDPEEFANLDEHTIAELARYATLKQLKAVMASEDWTVEEKREMVGKRWEEEMGEFRNYQRLVDEYEKKRQKIKDLVIDGTITLNGDTSEVDESQITEIDGKKYVTVSGVNYEAPTREDAPKLPSSLKSWARNKMTLPEYELAALSAPQMFDIKELVHAMRWGLTNKEIRTNENFSFDVRDRLSYDKDSNLNTIVKDAGDPNYIKSNAEVDAENAVRVLIAANPNATEKDIADTVKNAIENSVTRHAAIQAAKIASSDAERDLLARNPTATNEEKAAAKDRAYTKKYAELTPNDTLRREQVLAWKSGRAPDEILGARGRNRNSEMVHSIIDDGLLPQLKGKDTEDQTAYFETILTSYKDEENETGLVTDETRRALEYLFTDPRSKQITRPIETLSPELKAVYKKLENEGKSGSISFKSDAWRR